MMHLRSWWACSLTFDIFVIKFVAIFMHIITRPYSHTLCLPLFALLLLTLLIINQNILKKLNICSELWIYWIKNFGSGGRSFGTVPDMLQCPLVSARSLWLPWCCDPCSVYLPPLLFVCSNWMNARLMQRTLLVAFWYNSCLYFQFGAVAVWISK